MHIILAELKKLKSNKGIFGFFLMNIVFVIYTHFLAIERGIESQGYTVSIALAFLNNLGIMIVYFGGAIMYYKEYSCNTRPYMLLNALTRKGAVLYKIITMAVGSLGVTVMMVLFAMALHLVTGGGFNKLLPEQFLFQFLLTVLDLFLWGLVAYTLSAVSKSMILGFLIPLVFFVEMLIYPFVSNKVCRFMPNYNIRALLVKAFSNLDKPGSLISVPDPQSRESVIFHIAYLFVFLGCVVIIALMHADREEVDS